MQKMTDLQPTRLWQWFQQVCDIPHPSFHEEKLAEFIVNWAKSKNIWVERDDVGNILMRKPATAGMENRKKVALQAHLDMVPQKNNGTEHDFEKDSIKPVVEGEWVTAQGTTLGADNGIGLASTLAVLDSDDIPHPDLEVLLTMTEESGMEGAHGLKPNWLQSEILINTDTEENGEIYVGCAGGVDADIRYDLQAVENPFKHAKLLVLKGLRGGHSGGDIHTGRANAIKQLARTLAELQAHVDFQLADITGGSVRNAIPREASAVLVFDGDEAVLSQRVSEFEQLLKGELSHAEPNLSLFLQDIERPASAYSQEQTDTVINLINALPNGVMRNSDVIDDVVETSLSVGVLKVEKGELHITILIRSLNESGKQAVCSTLESITTLAGANVDFSHNYPGWEPDENSPILPVTVEHYKRILGEEPKVKVIHAGLECGLMKDPYPHIDMVSIGPTIRNAHSPDEKVHIPAVQTYWTLLQALLANIPNK
ncbi:aminoacyl-histidine dipeptidase [Pasteurellaceae bacterium 20609_3]|uniref:aminoacyl-histidine dipeptidase n=1 Tax=Spirabiliibacterium mucosae TaxID=28156 RepID=UPI001AAD6C46|nr:aminoacyl-histidine dipeptidase [Spirabiliibacterium mucosae]MBE2899096.1 aminoacyl-histidine dipeptidase [Spirabiliibacterium mucosae]